MQKRLLSMPHIEARGLCHARWNTLLEKRVQIGHRVRRVGSSTKYSFSPDSEVHIIQ